LEKTTVYIFQASEKNNRQAIIIPPQRAQREPNHEAHEEGSFNHGNHGMARKEQNLANKKF